MARAGSNHKTGSLDLATPFHTRKQNQHPSKSGRGVPRLLVVFLDHIFAHILLALPKHIVPLSLVPISEKFLHAILVLLPLRHDPTAHVIFQFDGARAAGDYVFFVDLLDCVRRLLDPTTALASRTKKACLLKYSLFSVSAFETLEVLEPICAWSCSLFGSTSSFGE